MKQLDLLVADKCQCIKSTAPQLRGDVTEFTVCAGDGNGKRDTWAVDSGGPLFCKRHDEVTYVVVGIYSWEGGFQQPNKYGVFTHLLNLIDWVHDQMAIRKCEPQRYPGDEGQEQCERPSRQLV